MATKHEQADLAKLAFLETLSERTEGVAATGNDSAFSKDINENQFVKLQKVRALEAAMNINMPMAKGIVDEAFLEKNRVVPKRKSVNPLGNFWHQNLDQIFKDF